MASESSQTFSSAIADGTADMKRREEEFIRYMESQGLLVHFPVADEAPPADFRPLVVLGEPASETILKDRATAALAF